MRIQFRGLSRIASLLVFVAGACVAGAEETRAHASTNSSDVLDEVVVTGTRLRKLRADVAKAEAQVLARYNELNQIDDFHFHCFKYGPTGSHILFPVCLTKLQENLLQKDTDDLLFFKQGPPRRIGDPVPGSQEEVGMLVRSADYDKNLAKVLRDNPDLRELTKQHGDARQRYEAARKEYFKSHVLLVE